VNEVRIGIIGYKFMGKAHSNAWIRANQFFSGPRAVLRAACGRDESAVRAFAENWGWQTVETDWRRLVARPDIDVIDIAAPNNAHAEIAVVAARHGKHVICEKPLGMNLKEAKTMLAAVRKAKVRNMVWHNYRRIPALQLARRIVEEGRIGKIYHIRAVYLQSFIIDPKFPLIWRLRKEVAGSGSHGDLNAHIIDSIRFITGSEPVEVCSHMETFIKSRPRGEMTGGLSAAKSKGKGKVTVDDAVLALAKFSNGAIGTFEATRFACGRKNGWGFEINGSKGAIVFNFERMNELEFYSEADPPHLRGFRNILVTEPGQHEYIEAWWPPGHIIGYEHTFVNQAHDFLEGVGRGKPLSPDFLDSTRNQAVLEAMSDSAKRRRWVRVARVK
jgi:predicted dehydrogenase